MYQGISMKLVTNRGRHVVRYLFFVLMATLVLAAYREDIRLLFASDPPPAWTYQCSFDPERLRHDGRIIEQTGFIPDRQGLQVLPGASGRLVFAFAKEGHQGCLIRVWFYGDKGRERPNAITIFPDGETPFRLAENENHIGTVFDISDRLRGVSRFKVAFEAENHAPFPARVLDAVEVVAGQGERIKPALPNLPKLLGLLFAAYVICVLLFSQSLRNNQKLCGVLLLLILLLAVYLRWNEVLRVSGTMLDEDARGYYSYAQKMQLAGDQGFYSAHFEKREPLFIFVVKLFFALFGASPTHLRFVSFACSLVTIYLTYRIGREWFHEAAGLTAAFILSIHPYLIQLSARGLREEWFTALILLFVYCGYITPALNGRVRAVLSGCIAGCICLTRSECVPMIACILLLYPLLIGRKWSYAMAASALVLSLSMWLPHQYSMYKKYGDFFYTANQYARFYANREFAGTPGFPTTEEIAAKGMYYGPKITPLAYYWNLHGSRQLLFGSLEGFAKIHLKMPLAFISGRGNAGTMFHATGGIFRNPGVKHLAGWLTLVGRLFKESWLASLMGLSVLLSFFGGLVLLGMKGEGMLFFYLIIFQIHTSFLASLGLDQRLTVHSYPLIAICCGYCAQSLFHRGRAAVFARQTSGRRCATSSTVCHNSLHAMVAG